MSDTRGRFDMTAYLINHLRLPGGKPSPEGLDYLEQVERTAKPYGARWLAQGNVNVVERAWAGSVVLMEFPSLAEARNWYNSAEYQKILHLRVDTRSATDPGRGRRPDITVAGSSPQQIQAATARPRHRRLIGP
jgi:uncharacterized protein (DUF1330 family)